MSKLINASCPGREVSAATAFSCWPWHLKETCCVLSSASLGVCHDGHLLIARVMETLQSLSFLVQLCSDGDLWDMSCHHLLQIATCLCYSWQLAQKWSTNSDTNRIEVVVLAARGSSSNQNLAQHLVKMIVFEVKGCSNFSSSLRNLAVTNK